MSIMSKVRYKYCVVPDCKSTTKKTPHKLFFSIPTGELRKKWCEVMRREPPRYKPLSATCNRFCCEDHFNVENDMENYYQWKLMGTKKLILKKCVFPHKFDCQRAESEVEPSGIKSEKTNQGQNMKETAGGVENVGENRKLILKTISKISRNNKTRPKNITKLNKVTLISNENNTSSQQIKRASQVVQHAEEIPQEIQELEKYTFQIKVEAVEENEFTDALLKELDPQNSTAAGKDSNQLLDVTVKVEELDEDFEPLVIKEESSQRLSNEIISKGKADDIETLLSLYDNDQSAEVVTEHCDWRFP